MSSVQIWLVVNVHEDGTSAEVGFTTQTMGHLEGSGLRGGVTPDTLRQSLRISERLADFADQIRST